MNDRSRLSPLLERSLPWSVLGLILLFTYAYFFVVPYAGLWTNSSGTVAYLYATPPPGADLRPYDRLLQVGPVRWKDFSGDFFVTLFEGARPGDVIPLVVERDGQTFTTHWVFAGPTVAEAVGP